MGLPLATGSRTSGIDSTVVSMTTRALPISSAGLVLVHQPASRYPIAPAVVPQPTLARLLGRFIAWWRQAGRVDLAWQEQRRLRDIRLLDDGYRRIAR